MPSNDSSRIHVWSLCLNLYQLRRTFGFFPPKKPKDGMGVKPRCAGCYFYGACQGGCGLYFNPTGEGHNCPSQGDCMSISMICQLQQ